ncbi:hypothetical protein PQU92_17265 [Asticcacaulis sp. BYS171W]|uniref:Abi-like protein n=1 Tax=Asticcacaulis aquaticus TaxID=2984212 RepID=A0ABT5HY73_9CAUL|nr:hypothetical protein [Asticcacaulis aquaticus]MDC7685037.1 hypothetical protein [Asticcacaulis aquaticus]
MGRPKHYSLELVGRCQHLIDGLVGMTARDEFAQRWRGPLTTTFLLAMSTPMIVLPYERLYQPMQDRGGVADDTELDRKVKVNERLKESLSDNSKFGDAPFWSTDQWSYIDSTRYFNIAKNWDHQIFETLNSDKAKADAGAALTKNVLKCIRNALSHGGIAYLDSYGRQSEDATHMLAFAAFPSVKRKNELRILRISVEGYQEFLGKWSAWLTDNGVDTRLSEDGPGWFDGQR